MGTSANQIATMTEGAELLRSLGSVGYGSITNNQLSNYWGLNNATAKTKCLTANVVKTSGFNTPTGSTSSRSTDILVSYDYSRYLGLNSATVNKQRYFNPLDSGFNSLNTTTWPSGVSVVTKLVKFDDFGYAAFLSLSCPALAQLQLVFESTYGSTYDVAYVLDNACTTAVTNSALELGIPNNFFTNTFDDTINANLNSFNGFFSRVLVIGVLTDKTNVRYVDVNLVGNNLRLTPTSGGAFMAEYSANDILPLFWQNMMASSTINAVAITSSTPDLTLSITPVMNNYTYSLEPNKSSATLNLVDSPTASFTVKYVTKKNGTTESNPDVTSSATWTSSDTSVATVSGGTVTAKKAGICTITATYKGVSAKISITVTNKTTYELTIGPLTDGAIYIQNQAMSNTPVTSQVYAYMNTYINGVLLNTTDVTTSSNTIWKSSDASVATVVGGSISEQVAGNVIEPRSCTITVKYTDVYTASATLYVLPVKVAYITVSKGGVATAPLYTGQTYQFKAVSGVYGDITNSPGTTWTSSNTSVAESLGTGSFKIKSVGTATITAKYVSSEIGGNGSLSISTTQLPPVSIVTSPTMPVKAGTTFLATMLQGSALGSGTPLAVPGNTVTWSSSNTSICTPTSPSTAGMPFMAKNVGTATIYGSYKLTGGEVTVTGSLMVTIQSGTTTPTATSITLNGINSAMTSSYIGRCDSNTINTSTGTFQYYAFTGTVNYSDGSTGSLANCTVTSNAPSVVDVYKNGGTAYLMYNNVGTGRVTAKCGSVSQYIDIEVKDITSKSLLKIFSNNASIDSYGETVVKIASNSSMAQNLRTITKPAGAIYSEYGGYCSEGFMFKGRAYPTTQAMFNSVYFSIIIPCAYNGATYRVYAVRNKSSFYDYEICTTTVSDGQLVIGPFRLAEILDDSSGFNYSSFASGTWSPSATCAGLFLNIEMI
jgi:hypothetical protein